MGISNIRCVSQPPPPNGKIVPCGTGDELPQSKPDGFSSSLGEGASGVPETLQFIRQLSRDAKGPISEGAGIEQSEMTGGVSHGVNPLRHRCAMPERVAVPSGTAGFAIYPQTFPRCQGPHPRGGCLRSRLGEFSPQSVCISAFPPLKVKNPAEKRFRWFKNRFGCAILGVKVPVWTGNRRA